MGRGRRRGLEITRGHFDANDINIIIIIEGGIGGHSKGVHRRWRNKRSTQREKGEEIAVCFTKQKERVEIEEMMLRRVVR